MTTEAEPKRCQCDANPLDWNKPSLHMPKCPLSSAKVGHSPAPGAGAKREGPLLNHDDNCPVQEGYPREACTCKAPALAEGAEPTDQALLFAESIRKENPITRQWVNASSTRYLAICLDMYGRDYAASLREQLALMTVQANEENSKLRDAQWQLAQAQREHLATEEEK